MIRGALHLAGWALWHLAWELEATPGGREAMLLEGFSPQASAPTTSSHRLGRAAETFGHPPTDGSPPARCIERAA